MEKFKRVSAAVPIGAIIGATILVALLIHLVMNSWPQVGYVHFFSEMGFWIFLLLIFVFCAIVFLVAGVMYFTKKPGQSILMFLFALLLVGLTFVICLMEGDYVKDFAYLGRPSSIVIDSPEFEIVEGDDSDYVGYYMGQEIDGEWYNFDIGKKLYIKYSENPHGNLVVRFMPHSKCVISVEEVKNDG